MYLVTSGSLKTVYGDYKNWLQKKKSGFIHVDRTKRALIVSDARFRTEICFRRYG